MQLYTVTWSGRSSDNVESGHIVQIFKLLEEAEENFEAQIQDILAYWVENGWLFDCEISKTEDGYFWIRKEGDGAWDSVSLKIYELDDKKVTIFEYVG